MRSLNHCVNNPIVINTQHVSLERLEFKENNRINSLFKLNLRKIIKNKLNKDKLVIHCVQGRMFYKL